MSSEAISTLRLSRWVRRRASFAVVVVLPEPCRPTIMIATGGTALRSMRLAVGAERRDQFVMDDLDHHLAGRDRLDDGGADRLLADAFGEAADHVERDVGLEQRAAHLAHRGIDVGFRQRTAPRQPIENATKLFRQIVEQCRYPALHRGSLRSAHPSRRRFAVLRMRVSKHFCARGRIALSGVDLRSQGPGGGSKRTSFRELRRVKPPESRKVKESCADYHYTSIKAL